MEELKQRCHQGLLAVLPSWAFRPGYIMTLLLAGAFSLLMFPLLRMIGLQVHATITGSYISGSHSLALLSCPNEQIARDIARAIMEKKLAASVDIFPRTSTMYFWKGEIEEATEILLLLKTRTSKIKELSDYIRSAHPFEIPELISLLIDQGNPAYLKWIEESIPYE